MTTDTEIPTTNTTAPRSPSRRCWIAFHLLRPIPPNRMNRGERGNPKSAPLGDVERLYLSSQSQRYAWRKALAQGELASRLGTRTRRLPRLVKEALDRQGADPGIARGMSELLRTIGKAESAPSAEGAVDAEDMTSAILYLTRDEIDAMSVFALAHADALLRVDPAGEAAPPDDASGKAAPPDKAAKKKSKKAVASVVDRAGELTRLRGELTTFLATTAPRLAPDVALFGRFNTSEEIRPIAATLRVAHAIGVTPYEPAYDFFTTNDDCTPGGPAAHMGLIEHGSAVFYQYLDLAATSLVEALGDRAEAAQTAAALARVVALVTPSGAENSTAPHTPPAYLEVHIHRGSQPLNLCEPFASPLTHRADADVLTQAVRALRAHVRSVHDTLYEPEEVVARFTFVPSSRSLSLPLYKGETRLASLAELCKAVQSAVESA